MIEETSAGAKGQFIYWTFRVSVVKDLFARDNFLVSSEDVKKWMGSKDIAKWIFQCEAGTEDPEDPYLHFQGWCKFRSKKRFEEVRAYVPGARWEKSNGPGAEKYAHKFDTRIDGPWSFPYMYYGADLIMKPNLKEWQKEVVDIVEGPVDPRKIYWYWENTGNVGKSSLCKYICWHYKGKLLGGRTEDALFAALKGYNEEKPIYLIDVPRLLGNRVPYEAIEQLKNGHHFNAKYENKGFMGMPGHIIVFANFPPDYNSMSEDRWVVKQIGEKPVFSRLID